MNTDVTTEAVGCLSLVQINQLTELVNDGIISVESLTQLGQSMELELKRKEILKNYTNDITKLDKGKYSGYYQTTLRNPLTNKRTSLRGKTVEELEDKIVAFYIEKSKHTIKDAYEGWMADLSINKKPSTLHAYAKVQSRHFTAIENKAIESFTHHEIKRFVKSEVSRCNLTAKGYNALKINLMGIFHYAHDVYGNALKIEDVVNELSRELRGSFAPSRKRLKQDTDMVFLKDEASLILDSCMETESQVDLGIALLFYTGLRVGELAAIKKEDISEDFRSIFICRTEERVSSKAEYIVSDTTKTEAGTREVLLVNNASSLIKKILLKSNKESEYLFSDLKYERYPAKKFRDRLYTLCRKLDIPKKSPHAIRRTYASELVLKNKPERLIIKQMGHVSFDITKMYYVYIGKSRDELIQELEDVMD